MSEDLMPSTQLGFSAKADASYVVADPRLR